MSTVVSFVFVFLFFTLQTGTLEYRIFNNWNLNKLLFVQTECKNPVTEMQPPYVLTYYYIYNLSSRWLNC